LLILYLIQENSCVLNVQVYDQDYFSRDDYVCGNTIDLTSLFKYCDLIDSNIRFDKNYYNQLPEEVKKGINLSWKDNDSFWLKMYKENSNTHVKEEAGKVRITIDLVPVWKSQVGPVGKGREDPNFSPFLPPPIGRFHWSLNPFTMFNQLVGPKMRHKICCFLCILACIAFLIYLIPYMFLHLGGQVVNPFNYVKAVTGGR